MSPTGRRGPEEEAHVPETIPHRCRARSPPAPQSLSCTQGTRLPPSPRSACWAPHIMMCRRRCRARWSEREKLRSQSEQRKGLMPVCLRKCRVSSSERANFQVQPSQVHL